MNTQIATIEAEDAQFHWSRRHYLHNSAPAVYVGHRDESYENPERRGFPPGCDAWFGAGEVKWHRMTDAARMNLLVEWALELIVCYGCDPDEVLGQLCKVRQFYELGADSSPMRRAISKTTLGRISEDWPPGSGENSMAWN